VVTIASYSLIYTSVEDIHLIAAQVFVGLAGAFFFVSWSAYISDLSTDEERAHLFGVSGGVSLLALLAGNILGGFMPGFVQAILSSSDLSVAYQLTLYLSLLPMALSGLLVIFMAPDRPTAQTVVSTGRVSRFSIRNVSHWGFVGRYTTTVVIIGLGAGTIVMFFNIFFDRVYTIDASLIGIIFGLNTVVLAVGNFASPVLADRIGKVKTIVLTQGVSVPFLVMLSIDSPLSIAIIAYVSRNVLMNMAGPVSNAFFVEGLTKEERATALGIVSTGDQFVRGIAANVGGWLLFMGQYRLPYLLTAALYVVSIVLFMFFFRNKEREMRMLRQAEVVFHEGPEIEAT
jgi:MFS family permease